MRPAKSVGRIIGMLLFGQLASAVLVYFVLLWPFTTGSDFLANAAGASARVRAAALLSFLTGALTVGIAIAALPVFPQHGYTTPLWFLVLSVVSFPLLVVENLAVLSLLSLSQSYAQAGAADAGFVEALAAVVGSARKWAHCAYALVGSGAILMLYGILYRFALVPRALAAFGLVAAVLHLTAYTMPFLGYPASLPMQMPSALSHLALALWLMAKGFEERPHLFRAGAQGVGLSGG